MRKITLLTAATLLSTVCIGNATLTAGAASSYGRPISSYGSCLVIAGGNQNCDNPNIQILDINCDINTLLEQCLQNLPSQNPCPPAQTPDVEAPDTDAPETEDTETLSFAEQVVNLVNAERAKAGIAPLSIDKNVQTAAQVRAVEIETSFSHTRPNGSNFSTVLKEQGVSYRRSGENIAWGQRTPEAVVSAWMNSEGHRANIMNANFTKIGVGYYRSANGVNYWSQLFID